MSANAAANFDELPGGEHVVRGLADLRAGRETVSALLLTIAAGRLADSGVPVPPPRTVSLGAPLDAEIRLYRLLRAEHGDDAHSQYNAHLRRLSSLCRALERAQSARAS